MKPTTGEQVDPPAGAALNRKSTVNPLGTQQQGGVGSNKNDNTNKQRKKRQTEGSKHQGHLIPAAAASAMTKLCPVRLRGVGSLSPKKSPRRGGDGHHRPSMTPLFSSPTRKRDGYKSVDNKDDDDGKGDPSPTTPLRKGHLSSSGATAAAGGGSMLPSPGAVSPSGTCTSSSSDEGAADGVGTTEVQWRAPTDSSQQPPPSSSFPRERALAGFCRNALSAEDLEDPIRMMQSVTTTTTAPADLGGGTGRGNEGDNDAACAITKDIEKKVRTVELELDRNEEEDEEEEAADEEDPEDDNPKREEADRDATSSRRQRRRRRRGVEDDDDPPLSGKFLVFQRLRSDDEDDVDIGGGENDDDDPLTISPQIPPPAPFPAPSALRASPSVADGGEEGGKAEDGAGEAVGSGNGDAPPPPLPSPSKGVTFAHDNPTLSLTGACNNNSSKRCMQEFSVNESDQHKSLPELLQTISVLRDRLSRASVDVSGEKALRRRKEKNLIKLARELNMMTDALREKDAQIKKLLVDQAALEEKLSSLGEQLENATQLSTRKSRDHHNEITLYQTKLRSCRRDFEEAAASRARQAEELRGRLLATSLECDRLRVTCAKMEMMRQTTDSAHRDIVRGTVLDAKVTQRSPGNDERRGANCLARVTGALSRALLVMAFSVLVLLLLFVVGCIAVLSQGNALSVPATRNVLCAPAPPGTVLEASVSMSTSSSPQSLTYDAPWWAPARFKERAYDALCDEDGENSSKSDDHSNALRLRRRRRCRLEWSSQGGEGKGTLTTTTLEDGRVWDRVGGISRARVGPFGALVPAQHRRRLFRRGRVDSEVFLPGPWAL